MFIPVTRKMGTKTWINLAAIDAITETGTGSVVRLRSLDAIEVRESPTDLFSIAAEMLSSDKPAHARTFNY